MPTNGSVSTGSVEPGAGNERATITFAVVYAAFPFGKPGGYEKPVGSKNGCRWSMPWSMIPIFIPSPAVPRVGPQSVVAPISRGVRSRDGWYVTVGQTLATPGTAASRATSPGGT